MKQTKSTCCYCGVGCGVIIESEADQITGVRGDPDHPANFGRLCTKGSTLHLSARPEGRALIPELRTDRTQQRQQTSWDDALEHTAERFAEAIKTYGPDSVAFYISGQLLTEDYYVFNKLAKGLIGTNNIDTNSRLCMSSAVAGYKASFGADAPPTCYEDIDHASCIFIAGANPAFAHPILYRRIEAAKAKNPDLKVIVADPRRTDTAQGADLYLPLLPGTDVALFNAMLHVMLWENLIKPDYIAAHTTGFDELKQTARDYTPKMAADICGLSEEDIATAARWFASSTATLSFYCQGLNQSVAGVDKNTGIINLHLATGQIGRPGAGPFSLTGQPNAMGGREVGGMANLLSGHRTLSNPEHRAEIADLWGIDSVPETPGLTAVDMFESARKREIQALWIACTNPAQSMPDLNMVREALRNVPFLVVQDAFRQTDTTGYADVLLPATTWGEKEGTVTNSERRITHVNPAIPSPGETRHDWEIVVDFAHRLGNKMGKDASSLFPYTHAEEIFNEHRATTHGRDLDISGLSYDMLDAQGPQQWPLPDGTHQGKARLYEDGLFEHPDGKARFSNIHYQPTAEKTDARYPLHLNTGRLRDQWHGMSRTGNVAQLFNHVEEPVLSMNRSDMQRRNLQEGDVVKISSRRGALVARIEASDEMLPTQTFFPMHWGSQHMSGAGVNALTLPAYDPVSKQPELKHAAIKIEKIELPWRMVLMRRGHDSHAMLQALQPYLTRFDYANCGLFGRQDGMVVLRAAHKSAPEPSLIAALEELLDLTEETPCLSYRDPRRGISKRVVVEQNCVTGVRLVGETLAAEWLKEIMTQDGFPDEVRRWALAPVSSPPTGNTGRGRIICNCMDVSEMEIMQILKAGAGLDYLQGKLKCGTECGSCVPELKRIISRIN